MKMKNKSKKHLKRVGIIFLSLILLLVICCSGVVIYTVTYTNPQDEVLSDAGIEEKTAQVGDVTFDYAEGPDNGPALVLLHAQLLDWYTYSLALPELSEYFHVYAIDYPGHGKTVVPDDYDFTANQIGSDLGNFIDDVIQSSVYVSGNSSGGLLATWLAANRPDIIKGAVLEDPPLFSSEYPEIKNTIAYKSFTTSHDAIEENYSGNFIDYWVENSTQFFKTYANGVVSQKLIKSAVDIYKTTNPDEPLELPFVSDTIKEMLRGLNYYNPSFGNAFYEGTWNEGFDHAEALSEIECPTLLLQANYSYTDDGILDGAMSEEDASEAMSLLQNGEYMKIDSNHVINLEHPDEFSEILINFFLN